MQEVSRWFYISDKRPVKFDLVVIEDENGKQQKGWWTGYKFDFGYKRISNPVKWRKDTFHKDAQ